jgi:hypothetical protein
MPQKVLFEKLTGKWEGTCRTWFEPGTLADESNVTGEITQVVDGRFLRHTYEGTIQGKPRHGEELIAFNSVANAFQTSLGGRLSHELRHYVLSRRSFGARLRRTW